MFRPFGATSHCISRPTLPHEATALRDRGHDRQRRDHHPACEAVRIFQSRTPVWSMSTKGQPIFAMLWWRVHSRAISTSTSRTTGEETIMRDVGDALRAPFGVLGRMAEAFYIKSFLTTILNSRNEIVKRVAESNEWKNTICHLPRETSRRFFVVFAFPQIAVRWDH